MLLNIMKIYKKSPKNLASFCPWFFNNSVKLLKMFLKILQNLQEKTCAEVSFW